MEKPLPVYFLDEIAEEAAEWAGKKLVDKKMVCNSEAVITVLKSRADYENGQRKEVIKEYFSNSLPQFVLSFIKERNLTREDIQELEKVIDEYKEELHE